MICEEYWPPLGETKTFGNTEVKNIKQESHGENIIKRTIECKKVPLHFF